MFEFLDVWKSDRKIDGAAAKSWTLKGVNMTLPQGRKIALLGPERDKNAIILQIMSGLAEPDRGAVRRVGVPCWPFDYSSFLENPATVQQNATFLGRVYGLDSKEITRIAAQLSGVRVVHGKPYNHYTSIERRALHLGLTLAIQFDWYFVNEKLPQGPSETSAAIDAALADRMERGSVIWATTDPDTVVGYCDAGLVLDRGTLTFYTSLDEAAEAYRRSTESKARSPNDRKSRETNRRRRAARRPSEVDPQKPV